MSSPRTCRWRWYRLAWPAWLLVPAILVTTAFFTISEIPEPIAADRVLLNGNFITMDASDTIVEAVAIKDGRILAVGNNADIGRLAGKSTERIDLQGKTATPGLLDAHCHFASGGGALLYRLDLSYPTVKSVEEVVEKVKAQSTILEGGAWVQGRGWDEGKLAENRYLYAADLDPVSLKNPVYLTHTMGHYGTANSLALKMANVTRDTPDPPGGTIDRDENGNPTGVLKESAQALVQRLIPEPGPGQVRQGIREIIQAFHSEGMTGLKDPGIDRATWEAYQQLLSDDELDVRVFALWQAGETVAETEELIDRIGPFTRPYVSTGDDRLISGGVKLYVDGSGGARTAWLYQPWNKNRDQVDEGNYGYPAVEPDILRRQIKALHNAGLHISVHSIGDRGIDWVVDSYEQALQQNPQKGLRHGIIHSNIPSDEALNKMARLQAEYEAGYPEPSAAFMWWIGDTYAGNFGAERALRLNPFQTYLKRGIKWANGSDFGVTPFPARYGLWASVKRETLLGVYGSNPWGMEESVDIRTALRSHTIWAAHQMFLEDKIGSLEPGKYADIAIWDTNIYEAPVDDIKTMNCLMTIFEGEVVFRAAEWPELLEK